MSEPYTKLGLKHQHNNSIASLRNIVKGGQRRHLVLAAFVIGRSYLPRSALSIVVTLVVFVRSFMTTIWPL